MDRISDVPKGKRLTPGCQTRTAGLNVKQSGITCNWIGCMMFYLLVSAVLYLMVKELGLWVALAVAAVNYAYMVLAIGTMLRMRGDISERNFIILVFEGFKIISLRKRIRDDSGNEQSNNSPRSKQT